MADGRATLPSDLLALMADARLPGDARWLAAMVQQMGCGWHEVAHDVFRGIIPGGASDDKISRLLRALEGAGWIESRRGGKGHSPSYRFIDSADPICSRAFRSALLASLPESVRTNAELNNRPAPQRTYETDKSAPERGQTVSGRTGAGLNLTVVVGEEEEVVDEEEERQRARNDLDIEVQVYLGSDGCELENARTQIRRYFEERVPTASQWAYLSTVRSWLQGGIGSPKGLCNLDDPVDAIASALIELLQLDEGEEVTMFKASRGKIGSTDTLRSKLEYLINRNRPAIPAPRSAAAPGRPRGMFSVER